MSLWDEVGDELKALAVEDGWHPDWEDMDPLFAQEIVLKFLRKEDLVKDLTARLVASTKTSEEVFS